MRCRSGGLGTPFSSARCSADLECQKSHRAEFFVLCPFAAHNSVEVTQQVAPRDAVFVEVSVVADDVGEDADGPVKVQLRRGT